MFRLIRNINLLILLIASVVSAIYGHAIVFAMTFFLSLIVLQTKNPVQMWIYFVFNQYFSIRYIEILGLNSPPIFGILHENIMQKYFLISVLLLLLIAFSIYIGDSYQKKKIKVFNVQDSFADKASILSIILFCAPIIFNDYRIGREINSFFSVLSIRLYGFLSWTIPAIFRRLSLLKGLLIIIFILSSIFFGSKAFLLNLINFYMIHKLLSKTSLRPKFYLMATISLALSIFLFNSFQSYRLTGDFLNLFKVSVINYDFSFHWLKNTFNDLGIRYAGLDTLAFYGESKIHFTFYELLNEISLAYNRFIKFFNFFIPSSYIPSEYFTAFNFRNLDALHQGGYGLIHTDSMFGLTRFFIADFSVKFFLFFLIFTFPFILMFEDNYISNLAKIYFYTNALIGGSYEEIIRIYIELFLISFIINKADKLKRKKNGPKIISK